MTKNNNLEDLLNALETIRNEEYSEISSAFLEQLLKVEYDNQDNRTEAQAKAIRLIDDYLDKAIQDNQE